MRDENELPPLSDSMTHANSDSHRAWIQQMTLSNNVTEFLTLPSSTCVKIGKPPGRARVLTWKESLAIMLKKEQKRRNKRKPMNEESLNMWRKNYREMLR